VLRVGTMRTNHDQSLIGLVRKFVRVAREQGGRDALMKASRRIQTSIELGTGLVSANLDRRTGLSDRALVHRIEPEWDGWDRFIDHLSRKDNPAFPFPKENFLAALRQHYPQEMTQTIRDAERICRREFHMLGQDFVFSEEINWHLDPPTGESWPRQYVGMMERWFWTKKRTMDALPLWELNRHQYFTTLGKAYWLTRDERYADEFCRQLISWIEQNSYQFGVNWFSVLEIGVRIISWSLAFYLFRDSSVFAEKAAKPFIKSLYQQTDFVRRHLTLDWEVQNNWLIGQATGLVTVGALFPEFLESQDWVETGLRILEREARLQTFSDGVNKEQAGGYHRFVLDLLLLVVVLGRRGTLPRLQAIEQVLESMLEYALYSMDPSGRLSQLGDTDEGWGFKFSEAADYWDVRPWLAVGAVLFHRPEFKFPCKSFPEEAFWLLGQPGRSAFSEMKERTPHHTSAAFDEGGHHVLRDNWMPESDFLIIKSGDFGLGGEGACAHAHCDLLSFVLWIAGRPLMVDSGTYTYHGQWRNRFRLTSAHNTLLIDGKDQAVPINEFFWVQVPTAASEHWNENRIICTLDVHRIAVKREIYHPVPGSWQIADTLSGHGVHDIDWFFHFAPDLSLRWDRSSDHLAAEACGTPYVKIKPPQDVELDIKRGWYSPKYGHKERNPVLVATWHGEIPIDGILFDWYFRYVGKADEER
jgi:hypothetical protein